MGREGWGAAGTINGITQTPSGYLWLATGGEGLVRFGGLSFVRADDLDALLGARVDRITSVICDQAGSLWVGTTHGLARLREGRWSAYDRGDARDVLGLHEAADGSIWYARHWEGLFHLTGETLTSVPIEGKPRFVATHADGDVWAGGYEGLWRLSGRTRRRYSVADGLTDRNVTGIHVDPEGNVWVGLQVGLALLRKGEVVAHFTSRDGLSDADISVLYTDRSGSLWVGTVNGGLNRRHGRRFESLGKRLGLTHDHVTALFEDREGSLWVGTANGLNRLRDGTVLPIGEAEGLSPSEPLSIIEAADGVVVVSSGFGGIARIDPGGIVRQAAASGSDFEGPLFADPDGGVWSGYRDGLSYRKGGRVTRHVVSGQVTCLARDGRDVVFAVGSGEVYRLRRGRAERYRLEDGSLLGPESFGFDYVWMLYRASDGTLWVATSRGAVAVHDGRARTVWSRGTLSARSVSEGPDGSIWLGTMAGLVHVAGGSVVSFTTREGLPQDDVYFALEDRRGGVWLSGPRGISRVARDDLEEVARGARPRFSAESFGVADGMRTAEATAVYEPAGCLTRDGRVWFTTTEGLAVVDPTRILRNPLPPPVLVESAVADGQELPLGAPILVPAGALQLAVHYNGLSLAVPQRVRFRYRLEGYDRGWVDAGGRRVAYYTKLPPGEYRFRVAAANNDGAWNEEGASVTLRQVPLFHQTRSFLAAVGLLVVGAALGAFALRVREHRRVERELQQRIREALADTKFLKGLLPICAWCRDDSGYWSQIETYVKDHSQADFTHGICPDCSEKVRQDPDWKGPGSDAARRPPRDAPPRS